MDVRLGEERRGMTMPAPSEATMYLFLIPLVLGFALDCASAFTATFSRRWGERGGQVITFTLRVILAMPAWVAGLILALRAPSATLLQTGLLTDVLGWLLVAAGCLPMILGLLALRLPAALPSMHDQVIAHGIYARVRHPIYSGMLLEFVGLVFLRPTLPALLAGALGFGWIALKARLEEADLVQRLPAYREYMQQVPRFVPRLPRKRST